MPFFEKVHEPFTGLLLAAIKLDIPLAPVAHPRKAVPVPEPFAYLMLGDLVPPGVGPNDDPEADGRLPPERGCIIAQFLEDAPGTGNGLVVAVPWKIGGAVAVTGVSIGVATRVES